MVLRFFRTALPLAFVLVLFSCTSEDAVQNTTIPTTISQNYTYSLDEIELQTAINDYRSSIGLSDLQPVEYAAYKAEEHNEYMIAKNVVNHDYFAERSQDIIEVLGAIRVNENVAYNYVSASSVLDAWLNSPGHKANIEGDFTNIGISIRENIPTGKKYYTNIFIKK